jgi:predicted transcriptional regulator
MKMTIKEFSESTGTNVLDAGGFIRFLEAKGMANMVEQRKSPSGKGKPSNVYEFAEDISLNLKQLNGVKA